MDRDIWAREYKRLLTAYGKPSNAEQAKVYFDALADHDGEAVGKAVSAALVQCSFFPTVADLVARCAAPMSDETDPLYRQFSEWQRVNRHDPALHEITFAMFKHYIEGQREAAYAEWQARKRA